MKVSIKTISEATGFSPATVSNALNHKPGVNARTAEKVLATAKSLGYFTERESRVSKIKFVIYKRNGVIVEDTPFFQIMTAGAEAECRAHGLEMVLYNLDRRDANFEDQIPLKVKNAIDSINRKIDEIKLQGTMVFKEEKDLGNSYQITIRIDK